MTFFIVKIVFVSHDISQYGSFTVINENQTFSVNM